jgi:TolB protein
MMRNLKFLLGAILCVIAIAAPARAQIKMEIIGPGSKLASIALPALKSLGGDEQHQVSGDFVTTLAHDLELSGYFRTINSDAYIEDSQASGYEFRQFNFANWSSINAEFLVKGAVTIRGSEVTLEALLYDVAQQRQLMGKRFRGGPGDVPRMARKFADGVLQSITGVRGPFDTLIAFVSTHGGRFKEVYTRSIDGTDLFRITNNPTINLFPSLDRSAREMLYTSYKTGAPALYLVNLGSRTERAIRLAQGNLIGGALSPDGQQIVAVVEREGASNLYLLDKLGQVRRQLTSGRVINVTPAFSPDGASIAFTSDRTGNPQIYLMSLGGGEARRLTYSGSYNSNPAFSPKGDMLAYQNRHDGVFDINLIPLKGGDPTRLTQDAGTNESPCWSPDGRYLLFSSNRSGRQRLYLMLVESGKITGPITEDLGDDTSPSWSWWLGG